jgi:pimeloyl-ACP methyl ester carboxylesterase
VSQPVPFAPLMRVLDTSTSTAATPAGVVLVLHGGKESSQSAVTARSLAWQRAAALGRLLARRLDGDRVAVRLLRYRSVGWNGEGTDKVADARWALDGIGESLGELPVVLVGHSMGGRTACRAADHPLVRGVIALAPWLPPGEPVAALARRELHAAHGRRDRITRASDTRAYVARASQVATATSFTDMGGRGHYLLGGMRAWNAFTLAGVRRILR